MPTSFENAVVWISGSGSGLGRAVSQGLARRGAVVIAIDIDEGAAEATAAGSAGEWVRAGRVDVVDTAAVAASIGEVVAEHGRVDFVFNSAGVGGVVGEARHFDAKHWDAVIDVNLRGVVNGIAGGSRRRRVVDP